MMSLISVAPASTAFSRSSFKALAGRSMTSPAAIWLTSCSGRRRITSAIRRPTQPERCLETPYR